MTIVISQIKDTTVQKFANEFDADKNGKLEGQEIELFNSAVQAKTNGEISFWDSKWSGSKIAKLTGDNAFTDWLQDKDKKCTDGKDDGKLSFKEGAKSYVKGLFGGIIKGIINHPVASAISVGLGAAVCVATGGAAAPLLLAAGTALAAGTTAKGFIGYAIADNDADAKTALETAGTGTQALALSALAVKPTLKSAKAAGVDTEHGILNTLKSSAKVSKLKLNPKVKTTAFGYEKVAADKTITEYYPNGMKKAEIMPDGTKKYYFKNGGSYTETENNCIAQEGVQRIHDALSHQSRIRKGQKADNIDFPEKWFMDPQRSLPKTIQLKDGRVFKLNYEWFANGQGTRSRADYVCISEPMPSRFERFCNFFSSSDGIGGGSIGSHYVRTGRY